MAVSAPARRADKENTMAERAKAGPIDGLKLRPLAAQDLDAVVDIDAQITGRSRRAYFERRLQAALRAPALHIQFAAEENGVLVGHVLARKLEGEFGRVKPAMRLELIGVRPGEQGLLWALVHRPVEGLAAVALLDDEDLEGLVTGPMFKLAASLADMPPDVLPTLLRERLSEGEGALLERAAAPEASTAPPGECVNALKRLRYDRERAAVQEEIDRLQEAGGDEAGQFAALWDRKQALSRKLEQLLDNPIIDVR
jgi:hypothetical protein